MRREWAVFSSPASGLRCHISDSRVGSHSLIWVGSILCRSLCVWGSGRRYQVCWSIRRYIGETMRSWPRKHDLNEVGWRGFVILWNSLETNNAACARCLRSLKEVWIVLMHEPRVNNEVLMIREWSKLGARRELASGRCDGTPTHIWSYHLHT